MLAAIVTLLIVVGFFYVAYKMLKKATPNGWGLEKYSFMKYMLGPLGAAIADVLAEKRTAKKKQK